VATLSTLPPQIGSQLDAPAPLQLWHLTSLDAPTVAVTWTLAFAWAARIPLPLWLPIVLGLAAWSFYIADRLLDARNARTPLRTRHHFHWKHRRLFVPIAFATAIVAIALVLHSMPLAARTRDSVLAAATLAYFSSVHSPWRPPIPRFSLPKELLVGILFTLACTAPTWTRIAGPGIVIHHLALLPTILIFTSLAWLNCHAIETWESASKSSHRPSTFWLAIALVAIALLTAVIAAALHQHRQAALLATAALSASLLALLDRHQHSLTPIALRCSADLVLLAPLALLAIS
jgi:hypothetical protein